MCAFMLIRLPKNHRYDENSREEILKRVTSVRLVIG